MHALLLVSHFMITIILSIVCRLETHHFTCWSTKSNIYIQQNLNILNSNEKSQSNLERAASPQPHSPICYMYIVPHISPKKICPSYGRGSAPHLIHGSLDQLDPPPQTTSQSSQSVFQNSRLLPTVVTNGQNNRINGELGLYQ